MVPVEEIRECSAEEFFDIYKNVKSLVEDQSQLQELVDAVNDKIRSFPEGFRPEELSLAKAKEEQKMKTLRWSNEEKAFWVHRMVSFLVADNKKLSPKTKKDQQSFTAAQVNRAMGDFLSWRNKKYGTKDQASKSAISSGIGILVEMGLLEKNTPVDEKTGKKSYAQTTYKILDLFDASSTKTKVEKSVKVNTDKIVESMSDFEESITEGRETVS